MDLDEMFRKEAEKYKNSKSVEVYEEQLEGWFKIIDELREENKKLKEKNEELQKIRDDREEKIADLNIEICRLKEENEYRKKIADVLPEGEGHIAEETIQDLQKEIKKLKEDVDYRHHRCMKAERQVQHSLGGDDEEGLYD